MIFNLYQGRELNDWNFGIGIEFEGINRQDWNIKINYKLCGLYCEFVPQYLKMQHTSIYYNFVDLHVMFFMAVRLNYINGIKRVQKTGITAS